MSVFVEMYSTEEGLAATFQIVNFIAWSPDPSQVNWLTDELSVCCHQTFCKPSWNVPFLFCYQPKPLQRGSAKFSLKDIERIDELTKDIKSLEEELDKGLNPKKEK